MLSSALQRRRGSVTTASGNNAPSAKTPSTSSTGSANSADDAKQFGFEAEFKNKAGPFSDVAPKEVEEARLRHPELRRHEEEIWKESQPEGLRGFLGLGKPAREQALIVYKNNADGTLIFDRSYKSSLNPETGEYSTIRMPKHIPVPSGYRLFIAEHTHPFPYTFEYSTGGGAGRGPSTADFIMMKNNSQGYHIIQAQPPGGFPKQFFYYGTKK